MAADAEQTARSVAERLFAERTVVEFFKSVPLP